MRSYKTGPIGTCADCGKKTAIHLGSMVKPVEADSWSPCASLIAELYRSAFSCIVPASGKYVKEYFYEKGEDYQYHKKAMWEVASKSTWVCPVCRLKASTLLWVDVGGNIGGAPDHLDGPFCGRCFKRYKRRFEGEDGIGADLPVYYLPVNAKRMEEIGKMFEDGWPPDRKSAPKGEPLDEVEGLF